MFELPELVTSKSCLTQRMALFEGRNSETEVL